MLRPIRRFLPGYRSGVFKISYNIYNFNFKIIYINTEFNYIIDIDFFFVRSI